MEYITSIGLGFIIAFVGLMAPSMLNMTVAKTSIERGRKAGLQIGFGMSIVMLIYCAIAVYFAKYLIAHPSIIEQLKTFAVFVFFALALFFFFQARKQNTIKGKDKKGHPIVIGLGMASLNMLGVPYFLAMATMAESKGWILLEKPFSILFTVGTFLGVLSLFSIYATFAIKIAEKASFIAKNINYILCGLFIILGLFNAYTIFLK